MKAVALTIVALCAIASSALADKKPAPKEPKTVKLPHAFTSLAFSPDGKTLVLGSDGWADVYDRKTMKRKYRVRVKRVIMGKKGVVQLPGPPKSIAFSRDGKTLALLNRFAEIQLHNAKTGERTGAVLFPRKIEELFGIGDDYIRFSPDGRQLALVTSGDCVLFETKTGMHLKTIGRIRAVVAEKDGRFLGLETHKSKIGVSKPKIIDLKTGKVVRELKLKKSLSVPSAAFSPDGRLVVLAGWPRFVVWDVKTGKQKLSFTGAEKEIFECGFGFSGDGKYLVAGSIDQTKGVFGRLRIWRLSDGKIVWKDERFREVPWVFGTTPDGKAAAYRFHSLAKDRINLLSFPAAKDNK